MKKRIITGIVLLAILLPLVIIDHIKYPIVEALFLLVGIFLSVVASYEMMSMFIKNIPTLSKLKYLVPIMSGTLVYTIYLFTTKGLDITGNAQANLVYHFLTMGLFIVFVIICLGYTIFKKNSTAKDMMVSVFTLTYCGLIMGFVINIRFLEPFSNEGGLIFLRGGRSFAYLYTIVATTDMFAFLIGTKFGRHKLCPGISPKKSVEGAIAGLIAGSLFGVVTAFLFKLVHPEGTKEFVLTISITFLISLLLSFTVQIGDLVASKIKRTYDIKDFGKIFPGHGGVLDRFDSLIFSGAVYYTIVLIIQIFYIWT